MTSINGPTGQPGTTSRADAFAAERAGGFEDARSLILELLVESHAVADATKEFIEPRLAILKRPPAKVLAVELEKVEGA